METLIYGKILEVMLIAAITLALFFGWLIYRDCKRNKKFRRMMLDKNIK